MRTTILTGATLAAATAATFAVSSFADLELEAVALLGIVAGAVAALVADASPGRRLAALAAGVVVALLGYLARAALLPDTTSGRATAAVVVVLLCTGVVLLSTGKLPLWAVLLGAGTFAGAYESAFAAAPPEVLSTSLTALTALALSAAVGFLAAGLTVGHAPADDQTKHRRDDVAPDESGLNVMEPAL